MDTTLILEKLVGAFADRYGLTKRECEIVMLLVSEGGSAASIAERLQLSRHTIHNHFKNVFRRTESESRAALMSRFILEMLAVASVDTGRIADEPSSPATESARVSQGPG